MVPSRPDDTNVAEDSRDVRFHNRPAHSFSWHSAVHVVACVVACASALVVLLLVLKIIPTLSELEEIFVAASQSAEQKNTVLMEN